MEIRREQEVTCIKLNNDQEQENYQTQQYVVIEDEQEDRCEMETYTTVSHNGESITMSLENLMKLYKLIGGTLGEYYGDKVSSTIADLLQRKANKGAEVFELKGRIIRAINNKAPLYRMSYRDLIVVLSVKPSELGPALRELISENKVKKTKNSSTHKTYYSVIS